MEIEQASLVRVIRKDSYVPKGSIQTLDLELIPSQDAGLDVNKQGPARHWALLERALVHAGSSERVRIRLVFAAEDGYVIRCDFLKRRMEGCIYMDGVKSFLSPLQHVSGFTPGSHSNLHEVDMVYLLSKAVGAVIGKVDLADDAELFDGLDREMSLRLSFPWLTKEPIERRRIVWVQGRENFESIRRAYEAAWALGITLVIVDQAGHWLEDDGGPYAYLREAFVPCSIDVDAGFPDRLVEVVRGYPDKVDGLVTISDVRLPSIAKACEMLGLPTEPYESYRMAGDKGTTRLMEDKQPGDFTAVVASEDEFDEVLAQQGGELPFPLIVKPCLGWNSDCVAKVRNLEELRGAVRRACGRHANAPTRTTRAVIEPYIPGPEVDANFIFLDGEVLFYQVSDDFPSTGDTLAVARTREAAAAPNFMETIMLLPSGLPDDEQLVLRESLKESIFRQGFRSGVIHCEARVRDSRTVYRAREDNGLMDLHMAEEPPAAGPSCYLHEINARPPGYFSSMSVILTHGVDYYAVRMLFSLGVDASRERIRALSVPFGHPRNSQYTLGIAVFPGEGTGVMETEDAIAEMMDAHPETRPWLADWQTMRKGGAKVFGPGENELWYVGYASVVSREGRKECLERVAHVKERFTYKVREE
ncbi:hypothetical protein S40293_07766 [Stachybotrys chartarum IBT 40293]|nr:hypothetical protein S40293_07766 [Stachybotrys chartarum IBT 40293]